MKNLFYTSPKYLQNLKGINSSASEIDDSVENYTKILSDFWIAPKQPPIRTDEISELPIYANIFTVNGDDILNKYEELRLNNLEYIHREVLGLDSSGLYTIYKYVFTPKKFTKTVILSTLMHGSELSAPLAVLRFLTEMVDNSIIHPILNYLRENIRIIVIPNINHYGSMQTLKTRQNANGVDLNRNFDFYWENYPVENVSTGRFKGTAPFSEVESVYIKNVIEEYENNTVAYIDFHNLGGTTQGNIAPIYFSKKHKNIDNEIFSLQEKLANLWEGDYRLLYSYNPTAHAYVMENYKILSCNPEWSDGQTWGSSYSNESFTNQVTFFGNLIYLYAKQEKYIDKIKTERQNYFLYFTHGVNGINGRIINNTSETNLTEFMFEVPNIKKRGIVKMNGLISVKLTSGSNQYVRCTPYFSQGDNYQYGILDNSFSNGSKTEFFQSIYSIKDVNDYVTIPFNATFEVVPNSDSIGRNNFTVTLSINGGAIQVMRYRCELEYIATNGGDSDVKILNCNTPDGTYVNVFPKE